MSDGNSVERTRTKHSYISRNPAVSLHCHYQNHICIMMLHSNINTLLFLICAGLPYKFYQWVISLWFQDEEFQEMLHSSERIEFLYGHLFDENIENADLSTAFEQLVLAVNRVETEPLWVPASWVQWQHSGRPMINKLSLASIFSLMSTALKPFNLAG